MPTALRTVLQAVQRGLRLQELRIVLDPDLGQTLVRRQLPGRRAQVLALHRSGDAVFVQRMHPERGDREVGGLGESAHRGAQVGASSGGTGGTGFTGAWASRARSA